MVECVGVAISQGRAAPEREWQVRGSKPERKRSLDVGTLLACPGAQCQLGYAEPQFFITHNQKRRHGLARKRVSEAQKMKRSGGM